MSYNCPDCGNHCEDHQRYCPHCGAEQKQPALPEQPMKWYKFIIYFQLFATAVINGLSGILALTGQIYDDTLYYHVSGLRFLDLLYGIALLSLAVYAVSVRKQLKHFHRSGPASYLKLLVVICVVGLAYSVIANVLILFSSVGRYYTPDYSSVISNIVTTVFWYFVNKKYFANRAHLFVNT